MLALLFDRWSETINRVSEMSESLVGTVKWFNDAKGYGFITREEWGGSGAVFDALDVNGDGRISPEEMAAGLGAAFLLERA